MEASDQLYHNVVMDRVRNPRRAGRLEKFDAEAEGNNPLCGDRIHVYVDRDGSRISHESQGCAIMIASAELMADAVAGKNEAEIRQLQAQFETVVSTGTENPVLGNLNALANLSEYRSRIRCATLPWSALAAALDEKDQKNG
jgi:nitrogen fixation NifU-like protein